MNRICLSRRAWLLALPGLAAGCQTPSQPGHPMPREVRLRALGFEPDEDGWSLNLSARMLFGFDADALDAPQRQQLMDLGRELAALGIASVRIEGHTDQTGSSVYNLRLAQRRAEAVAAVLKDSALGTARFTVRGLGKEKLVCTDDTDACRAQNRRVVLIVPAGE